MFSNWPCSVVREERGGEGGGREETGTRGRRRKGGGMTGLLSAWLHVRAPLLCAVCIRPRRCVTLLCSPTSHLSRSPLVY